MIFALFRAEDGAQTRDPQLGRLMLYRLSYFRKINVPIIKYANVPILLLTELILTHWHINSLAYLFVGSEGFEPPKSKDS